MKRKGGVKDVAAAIDLMNSFPAELANQIVGQRD